MGDEDAENPAVSGLYLTARHEFHTIKLQIRRLLIIIATTVGKQFLADGLSAASCCSSSIHCGSVGRLDSKLFSCMSLSGLAAGLRRSQLHFKGRRCRVVITGRRRVVEPARSC